MINKKVFSCLLVFFCLSLTGCQPESSFQSDSEADQTDSPSGDPSSAAKYILEQELNRVESKLGYKGRFYLNRKTSFDFC